MQTLDKLQIRTLGEAQVWVNGSPVQWRAESARELFFYLLAHPEGHTREHIIEALWNIKSDASASNRFRVTVHRIRAALGWPGALLEEYSRYRLSEETLGASDVYVFYRVLEQAERATGLRQLELYQQALALYQGEFLPSEDGEWASEIREQLRAAYAQTELKVAHLLCGQGKCRASVAAQARALRADPYVGENHHQSFMRCLWQLEGKYTSVEYYRRFIRFLRDELGDTPMPETTELAEEIKRGADTNLGNAQGCPFAQRFAQALLPTRGPN